LSLSSSLPLLAITNPPCSTGLSATAELLVVIVICYTALNLL